MRSLALTLLVLGLLGGTAAAFAITEVLKLERSPVTAPRFDKHFSPVCACPKETASLSLRLRKGDTVDVAIVDSSGEVVRTLVSGERHGKGPATFEWNGMNDAGLRVRDGTYRLRIRLSGQHRTIVIPSAINVDTRPPSAELLDAAPRAFSPDEDGRRDRVRISYTASEPAKATLLVDGEPAKEGKLRSDGEASVLWNGEVLGRAPAPGPYELWLRVTDRAGNVSAATERVAVRLRFIELNKGFFSVRRGGRLRFAVGTDAKTFSWTIRGSRGRLARTDVARRSVVVRLPRRLRPGRYVLRVETNGRSDQGVVRILRQRP